MPWSSQFKSWMAQNQKDPVFVVALSSTTNVLVGGWGAYSSSALPNGGQSSWQNTLVSVSAIRQTRNPREGRLGIPRLRFEILKTDDKFLDKVVSNPVKDGGDQMPTFGLYMGSRTMLFSQFARVFLGSLRDIKLRGNLWIVDCASFLEEANGECMTKADAKDLLKNGDLDSWSSNEPNDWTKFESGTSTIVQDETDSNLRTLDGAAAKFAFDGSGSQLYIDQTGIAVNGDTYCTLEIWSNGNAANLSGMEARITNLSTGNDLSVAATSTYNDTGTWATPTVFLPFTPGNSAYARALFRFKTEPNGPHTLQIRIRGIGAGLANAIIYIDDVSISQKVVARGNPIDLVVNMLGRLLSVNTNHTIEWLAGEPTSIDLNVSSLSFIRSELAAWSFKDERDAFAASQKIETTFVEPVKAMTYLEEEAFRMWGFLYLDQENQILWKSIHDEQPDTTSPIWDDAVMLDDPGWRHRLDLVVNTVKIWGDWESRDDEYQTLLANIEKTPSNEPRLEMVIKSRWLRTEYDGVNLATAMANRILHRFSKAPEELRPVKTHFTEFGSNTASVVRVTNARMPNLETGVSGKTKQVYEVVGVDADFEKMDLRFTLSRSYFAKSAWIAPSASPDFTSATEDDKLYAYIAGSADQKMSDGSLGYTVG